MSIGILHAASYRCVSWDVSCRRRLPESRRGSASERRLLRVKRCIGPPQKSSTNIALGVTTHGPRRPGSRWIRSTSPALAIAPKQWEKVVTKFRTREMPPPGGPRPDDATYAARRRHRGDCSTPPRLAEAESGPRSGPPLEPHRVHQRRSAICSDSRSMDGRCCRRTKTRSRKGSTTSPASCRCRRRCLRTTCPPRGR